MSRSSAQVVPRIVHRVVQKIGSMMRHAAERLAQRLPISPETWAKLDLLKTLVQRDLEARYKGSMLGNVWPLVHQLAQLLVYTYVFSIVLQVKLSLKTLPTNNFTFGLWLFAGLIPWTAFVMGLTQASTAVIAQPNLVKKVVFPLALLPLVPIGSAFLESTLGLMALVIFTAFMAQTVHSTLWLLPLIWIPQLLFTAGLGYWVAGLTVFLRDIPQTIAVVINLWFYVTPIIYPASVIPAGFRDWVFWLNPMAAIAEVYRDLILVGAVHHGREWGVTWVISSLLFFSGLKVYQRLRPGFADVL
jgi:lipopolysaccharide transport system permease protein